MTTADMLLRRLRLLIDRALLQRVAYRGKVRVMQVQVREGVPLDNLEHLEPHGFTSHALQGAEAVLACRGGNRSDAVVLMVNDRRHRIVVAEGETAIYTHSGERVHLKADGSIHMKSATRVLIESPEVEITNNLIVGGGIQASDDIVAGTVSLQNHLTTDVVSGDGLSGVPQA